MFSLDGFFANILAGLICTVVGIGLTLGIIKWWLDRRERLAWQPIQRIALRQVEYLADILFCLKAAAKGDKFQRHPMWTFNATLFDAAVPGDLHQFPPQIYSGDYNDPQWPRAIKETAEDISYDLLRYPVVARQLCALMVDLERLRLVAARWEEWATYLAGHGLPGGGLPLTLTDGEALLVADGHLACFRTLELAASCIEEARKLRGMDARDSPLRPVRALLKRIWPPRGHKQEPPP